MNYRPENTDQLQCFYFIFYESLNPDITMGVSEMRVSYTLWMVMSGWVNVTEWVQNVSSVQSTKKKSRRIRTTKKILIWHHITSITPPIFKFKYSDDFFFWQTYLCLPASLHKNRHFEGVVCLTFSHSARQNQVFSECTP